VSARSDIPVGVEAVGIKGNGGAFAKRLKIQMKVLTQGGMETQQR
jgi:hypothetical protein